MLEKPATTLVTIHDIIARRWSPRAYDPVRPVERTRLLALLEAARWAPSCYGDEPWRFVVCDRYHDEARWTVALGCLAPGNQTWAQNAPVLALAVSDSAFSHNDKPNRWGGYDTGAASISLALQAAAEGMIVHQMGGFDPDQARKVFAIPERFTPMAMIAIGYQAELGTLSEEVRQRELQPRQRRPLEDSFFDGRWGVGITE